MGGETDGKAQFEIVRADATRVHQLEPIWRSLSDHHAELTPAGLPTRPSGEGWPLRRERYERSLGDGAALLIAQDSEGPIGYALAILKAAPVNLAIDQVLEVETVAVLPSSRGVGVGAALMDAVGVFADEVRSRHLQVAVRTANKDARRFYERRGFKPLYVTMVAERDPKGRG